MVLALGGPVQDRLAVLGAEQLPELALRDPAGPDARVIRRVAGHRDHPAGGGHHDRRAAGGQRVALRLDLLDRPGERVVGVLLNGGVDAGHQVVAGLGGGLPDRPRDLARGVDRDHLAAGGAAQLLVVLALQAGLADQVDAGEAGLRQAALLHLLRRDRLQVPQRLREGGADGLDVVDDRLHLGGHAGELALALQHLHRHLVRDVLRHRDRLVRRALPARLGHGLRADPHLLAELLVAQCRAAPRAGAARPPRRPAAGTGWTC